MVRRPGPRRSALPEVRQRLGHARRPVVARRAGSHRRRPAYRPSGLRSDQQVEPRHRTPARCRWRHAPHEPAQHARCRDLSRSRRHHRAATCVQHGPRGADLLRTVRPAVPQQRSAHRSFGERGSDRRQDDHPVRPGRALHAAPRLRRLLRVPRRHGGRRLVPGDARSRRHRRRDGHDPACDVRPTRGRLLDAGRDGARREQLRLPAVDRRRTDRPHLLHGARGEHGRPTRRHAATDRSPLRRVRTSTPPLAIAADPPAHAGSGQPERPARRGAGRHCAAADGARRHRDEAHRGHGGHVRRSGRLRRGPRRRARRQRSRTDDVGCVRDRANPDRRGRCAAGRHRDPGRRRRRPIGGAVHAVGLLSVLG